LLRSLEKEQTRLAGALGEGGVRWVRPEQVHLTLRFYGSVAQPAVPELTAALRQSAEGIAPFQLSVEGIGCFPSTTRPKVVWFGLAGEVEPLQQLARQVAEGTALFGSHSEVREFRPHLTVARVAAQGVGARRVGEAIRIVRVGELGRWRVDELTLMRSRLHPSGSVYTPLARIALSGS
jgi:2'-5' RNA ligase